MAERGEEGGKPPPSGIPRLRGIVEAVTAGTNTSRTQEHEMQQLADGAGAGAGLQGSTQDTAATSTTQPVGRFKKVINAMQNNTLEFLGLTDDWADSNKAAWDNQRLRLASRQGPDAAANERLDQQRQHVRQIRKSFRARSVASVRDLADQPDSVAGAPLISDQRLRSRDQLYDEQAEGGEDPLVLDEEDEEDEEEDSDDELQKESVAKITFYALSKAVTKWKKADSVTFSNATAPPPQPPLPPLPATPILSHASAQPPPPPPPDTLDARAPHTAPLPPVPAPEPGVERLARRVPGYWDGRMARGAVPGPMPSVVHVPRKRAQRKGIRWWLGSLHTRVRDNHQDARPYFTYWVTSVHVAVLLLSMVLYPWAPFGVGLKNITGEVLTTSLSLEVIEYEEPASVWLGPSQHALVAMGAKFTPCMRPDPTVQEGIMRQRELEASTGCCVRYDQSGCVQTTDEQCSDRLSHWDKWGTDSPGPDKRLSGPVCGQDPRFCTAPASVAPNVWPDDISEWPLCRSSNASMAGDFIGGSGPPVRGDNSATCEVIGRPCCVGVHGECHITTREHCTFLHGRFNEQAALCSQVSCLSEVCRMLKFLNPEVPDQVYRLWVSLFIHPGILAFGLTLVLHLTLLRNMEKFAGTIRVTIIYITSGIAGNLASAIFVPYRPEVGPAGSLSGVVACLFVIFVADVKDKLRSSWRITVKWTLFLIVSFVIGLMPGVDNYANIFGFLMGLLLSAGLLPHVGQTTKQCRLIVVLVSLSLSVALLVTLVVLLYLVPFQCDWCGYLDCLPFTADFCAEQQTSFERHMIIT